MSKNKIDKIRKSLEHRLSIADDDEFLQMIWSIHAIQAGNSRAAAKYLTFPEEAVAAAPGSKFSIYLWELETITNLMLTTNKNFNLLAKKKLNCKNFNTATSIVNTLRYLEDEEFSEYKDDIDIFLEMHRIAHRQFNWQRGYINKAQMYRSTFIYNSNETNQYFFEQNGIEISEYVFIGYCMYAAFTEYSSYPYFLPKEFSIPPEKFRPAMSILSCPIMDVRAKARVAYTEFFKKMKYLPIAYRPSILRRYPIITFNNLKPKCRSPLPELIIARITTGLYYDIISGGQSMLNAISDRFEQYTFELTSKLLPDLDVDRSSSYTHKKNRSDTPDIIVSQSGKVSIVIECKATKLTLDAQFSDRPMQIAATQHKQISKGVFQIWKFFSHARNGLLKYDSISNSCCGIVLTHDNWLETYSDLQNRIIEDAKIMALKDDLIEDQDMRKVLFCSIQDFEHALLEYDESTFLSILSKLDFEKYRGWSLRNAAKHSGFDPLEQKPYPFDVKDVLPWWKALKRP